MLQLALAISTFLEPLFPYIVKGTIMAAEEAAMKYGPDVWEKGKNLWEKLYSQEQPELKETAVGMAVLPQDTEAKQAFTQEVLKSLEKNPDLCKEIECMMQDIVIQRVIAKNQGEIESVKQNAISNARQEVIADNGTIKGVEQTQHAK